VRITDIRDLTNKQFVATTYSSASSNLLDLGKSNKSRLLKRAWVITLVYLLMQVYVLYMNTYHIFTGAPPMCQICVAVDSSDAMAVNTTLASVFQQYLISVVSVQQAIYKFVVSIHLPRAPPSL